MPAGLRVSMRRREFIALVGGAAAWPLAAHAQQDERIRRVAVLSSAATDPSDPEGQANIAAFLQALQQLGWISGQNLRIDHRVGANNAERIRKHAVELAALAPDVIISAGASSVGPLLQATRSVPVVFVNTADPVGAGYAESLARPGGNATGFMAFEYSLSGKWLELLKQIAPGVTRAGILRDAAITSGTGQFAVIQSVAPSVGIDVSPIGLRDAGEIERGVAAFARLANGGLIVTASAATVFHRDQIITLAARHKLPTVYPRRLYVTDGGLISYGADIRDQFRRAAGYVDRILKGEKPADLPVQAPNKYELVINLKAAKALGLSVPPTVLARADAIIE
jgi:putative tryptophan/tyrosine transport system substrate-binding protein